MSARIHGLQPVLHVFGDESGSFRPGDWQIIGLLFCSEPIARRAELAALRVRYDFQRELKYSDTDVLGLPYALAVIDWFLNEPDLKFRCIAKTNVDLSRWTHGYRGLSPEELAYNYTYKQVLSYNLGASQRALVTVDQQTRTKGNNLLDYLKKDLPSEMY